MHISGPVFKLLVMAFLEINTAYHFVVQKREKKYLIKLVPKDSVMRLLIHRLRRNMRIKKKNKEDADGKDIKLKEIGHDNLNSYESLDEFKADTYEGITAVT